MNHAIKLYPPGAAPNALSLSDDAPPVVAETYEEVVFTDPTERFYRQLMRLSVAPKVESSQQEYLQKTFSDNDDFLILMEAQKFLKEELSKAKQQFKVVSSEHDEVDKTLAKAQHQQREAASRKAKAAATQRKSKPSSQPATKKSRTGA